MHKSSSSAIAYPSPTVPAYRPVPDEEAEPTIGYPAPVDGQPFYAYLPPAPPDRRRSRLRKCCAFCCPCCGLLIVALVGVAAFFVWPRSLEADVTDIKLADINFSVHRTGDSIIPRLFLNITLNLRILVENPNYFSATYETVVVSILYEGDEIGEVVSHGGDIKARSTSSEDATLELNSYEISNNVLSLIADIASGALPFRAVTEFDGHLNVLWFRIPLKGKVSCDIVVDPQDQVLLSQDCDI